MQESEVRTLRLQEQRSHPTPSTGCSAAQQGAAAAGGWSVTRAVCMRSVDSTHHDRQLRTSMPAWYSASDSCWPRLGQPAVSHLMYAQMPASSPGSSGSSLSGTCSQPSLGTHSMRSRSQWLCPGCNRSCCLRIGYHVGRARHMPRRAAPEVLPLLQPRAVHWWQVGQSCCGAHLRWQDVVLVEGHARQRQAQRDLEVGAVQVVPARMHSLRVFHAASQIGRCRLPCTMHACMACTSLSSMMAAISSIARQPGPPAPHHVPVDSFLMTKSR